MGHPLVDNMLAENTTFNELPDPFESELVDPLKPTDAEKEKLEKDPFYKFLPMSLVREYVGLFGDISDDDMLMEFRNVAIRAAENYTTRVIIPRTVIDYYKEWNPYFELTQKAFDSSTVVVNYQKDDYSADTIPIDEPIYDGSGLFSRVLFPRLPNYGLSDLHANPISVAYQALKYEEMDHAACEACLYYIKEMYLAEREPGMKVNMQPFYLILNPYKLYTF